MPSVADHVATATDVTFLPPVRCFMQHQLACGNMLVDGSDGPERMPLFAY